MNKGHSRSRRQRHESVDQIGLPCMLNIHKLVLW